MSTKPLPILILLLASLNALGPLSIDMYLPALPLIARDLSAPLASVELSLTTYFFGLALGQLIWGPLADRLGRKPPLYIGLSMYGVASIGCAFAPTTETLILGRLFQALGGCTAMVIPRAMVRDLFSEREAARVFSLLMLVMGAAPILAPFVGGLIAKFWGWRMIFGVLSAASLISFICMALFLPETKKAMPHPPGHNPLLTYLDILKDRRFLGSALAGSTAQAGMFAYITGSPFVFIEFFGVPADRYGWVFGTNALALIAASQLNVRLLRKYTPIQILRTAFWVLATAGVGVFASTILETGFLTLAVPIFTYVGLLGATLPNTTAAALAHEGARAGSASALLGTIQFTLASSASGAVSYFHGPTPLAMTGVIGICGLMALLISRLTYQTAR